MTSGGPPAGDATTSLIGRSGNACALCNDQQRRDQRDENGEHFLLHMFLPEDSAGAMSGVMIGSNHRPRKRQTEILANAPSTNSTCDLRHGCRQHPACRGPGDDRRPGGGAEGRPRHGVQDSGQREHSRQLRARLGPFGERPERFPDATCDAALFGLAGRHPRVARIRQSAAGAEGAPRQWRTLHPWRDLQGAAGRHVRHPFAFASGHPAQPDLDQAAAGRGAGGLPAAGNADVRDP